MRKPALLAEGILKCTAKEKRFKQKGLYRSIVIKRIWSLSDVLRAENLMQGQVFSAQTDHVATGFPGENPHTGAAETAKASKVA